MSGPTAPLWVGTSWKMTKTRAEGVAWSRALADAAAERGGSGGGGDDGTAWPGVQPFVMPPATALVEVAHELTAVPSAHPVLTGGQDAHWEDAGAWTGEVSVPQLVDAGARLVELGHSERRAYFDETDARVALKVDAALRHGLVPLVCVGETQRQRDDGHSVETVLRQASTALAGVGDVPPHLRPVVAYEPVWAIGVGGREATAEDIGGVVAALAEQIAGRAVLLYGGSVTVANAPGLLDVEGVDGLFVGRTAWDVDGYVALLDLAAARR